MNTLTTGYGAEEIVEAKSFNLAHAHERDSHIHFYPENHIYTFDDQQLYPVSTVIAGWFSAFDPNLAAERKATNENPKEKIMEEWDCNGSRARYIGTFMHSQIERTLLGEEPVCNACFEYHGKHVHVDEEFDIEIEMRHFRRFFKERGPIPFRTEWRICDEEHRLAGTIDFLARDREGNYEMYDWKRSSKILTEDSMGGVQRLHTYNDYGRHAFGDLSHLSDTPYTHYCLQQNLYRYMLRRHYGITVEKMYLVVLHPTNRTYHCVQVPVMECEVETMLSRLK